MSFAIALIQMRVKSGAKEINIDHATDLVTQAATDGARLALLPETVDLGWMEPSSREEAEPIPDGTPCRRLAETARRLGICVCAGLTELHAGRVFNSAVLIDETGTVLLVHRKVNELPVAQRFYDQGDRLGVTRTALGRIGLMICADAMAKDLVLGRSLGHMGSDIILSPCAWAVKPGSSSESYTYGANWQDAYRSIACEFGVWIAAASNVGGIASGPWSGRLCIGSSVVIGPCGQEVVRAPFGVDAETILYVDVVLSPHPVRERGWDKRWHAEESSFPQGVPGAL